ncbi:ankyrin repeat-containing domain protein [Flagelloscypha sp. PMI_526]|nr:ankyrin repeat-containing domain protein [Flagelloscypha sp. PMI_526]
MLECLHFSSHAFMDIEIFWIFYSLNLKLMSMIEDFDGRSGISFVSSNGHLEILEILLGLESVIIDSRSANGRSPLHYVCEGGHTRLLERLIERSDVDKNARDNYGNSPLAFACRFGRLDMMALLLLTNEVEANTCNINGESSSTFGLQGWSYSRSSRPYWRETV